MLYVIGAVVLLAGGYFLYRRFGSSEVRRVVNAAIAARNPRVVVEAANRLDPSRQVDFYQQAITMLWEGWHRPLAIRVIRAFANNHSSSRICQFWLRQALEVEPDEAKKVLNRQFLKRHFNPEVAACCYRTSS